MFKKIWLIIRLIIKLLYCLYWKCQNANLRSNSRIKSLNVAFNYIQHTLITRYLIFDLFTIWSPCIATKCKYVSLIDDAWCIFWHIATKKTNHWRRKVHFLFRIRILRLVPYYDNKVTKVTNHHDQYKQCKRWHK